MRRQAISICIAVTWAVVASLARAFAQSPSPSPSPQRGPAPETKKPGRPAERLHIDVEGQVERLLEEQAAAGLPRFETSIEVKGKTPQVMIERFFGGQDVDCAPAGVGAPTAAELGQARPTPPPTADLLALAQVVLAKIKGRDKRADRYFLYGVRRGTDVGYQLRETRVPVTWLYGINGSTFELIDSFPELDDAVRALRRRERGLGSPAPAPQATSTALKASGQSPCRPRRD